MALIVDEQQYREKGTERESSEAVHQTLILHETYSNITVK